MKQKITLSQLNELSEKGKGRLRKWWKPVEGDWYALREGETDLHCYHKGEYNWPSVEEPDALPLLSIGQMIEFLDWHWLFPLIQEEENCCDNCPTKYKVEFYYNYPKHKAEKVIFVEKELCTALWEAVKQILEQ